MKVYVVEADNGYDAYDSFGIFSSREKAQERINQFSERDRQGMEIEEYIVDAELK